MVGMVLAVAEARTVRVELVLAMSSPPEASVGDPAAGGVAWTRREVRGPDVAAVVADDGRLATSCEVRDGELWATVRYRVDAYPEHLPQEIGCTVGRYDVRVRILTAPPLYTSLGDLVAEPGRELELRAYAPGLPLQVGSYARTFALPSTRRYAPGRYAAAGAGDGWDAVSCVVGDDQPQTVRIEYPGGDEAHGVCRLKDDAGRSSPLKLRRCEVTGADPPGCARP